jgi:hypothetical protein
MRAGISTKMRLSGIAKKGLLEGRKWVGTAHEPQRLYGLPEHGQTDI